ncbi:nucleotidyltransferase family protein [Streptomyces sp. WI04-05B]|uniref:nucleotidyltransferase family protein n=1 Tax=Streptomyces TaxID=1883 RepID=UPI0029A1C712|nr:MULTISPECIES: sugar phosphate nucleotidyltransferase [unclassified Streptomyces]MDX2545385.1 sugar phosphate nucleotidyltransferase [Streptomyces sp. WI04-05B]MDX2588120.1 sugar phosphate nucleotidyltransferase [Streptomyces sp. WI04-05A]
MAEWFGIVPAAGAGTRLAPYRAPKELIQIGYRKAEGRLLPKTVIEYLLTSMRAGGIRRAFVPLSPAKADVFRYLGSGGQLDMDLAYLCQDTPLGMPAAIDLATPFLADRMVCMGMPDTVIAPADCFSRLVDFHTSHGADVTLGVFPTDHPERLAPVVIDVGTHRVRAIVDKPRTESPVRNTWGIAAWSPAFTELLHDYVATVRREPGRELLMSDVFMTAVDTGLRVHALDFESGEFHDVGTPEGLLHIRARFDLTADVPARSAL